MTIRIESTQERDVSDADLQRLLMRAYLEGGFTAPERAAEIFSPAAVRARGEVLCAWPAGWTSPAGMVVVVLPPSPARRLAGDDEAEMHLLATDPECRRVGVGRALVAAAMDRAREAGLRRVLLWTQPSMRAALRLYASAGFVREPERDFQVDGGATSSWRPTSDGSAAVRGRCGRGYDRPTARAACWPRRAPGRSPWSATSPDGRCRWRRRPPPTRGVRRGPPGRPPPAPAGQQAIVEANLRGAPPIAA